ncbi:hypothetical protein Halru_2439 [Halovivax ruber XH-70]|uniref:Uncharacterized protein n=1 Tax=Halovivax ruber (strain DSM 18193 / JCM 13892 / XH-70) TaxID=797302 RepID=L0IFM1_HALRX|nr:hypothetical protein [Halovivax ruber]AGB17021.1 hypothetical protein Halru_2439 [Halovivax ruber XH-70]
MSDGISRRRALALLGTTATATVAGCLSDEDAPDDGSGALGSNTGADSDAEVEDTGPAPDDVTYGDVVEYESSFAVDLVITGEMAASGTQVVYEGDYRVEIEEEDGQVVEMYGIDGQHYINVMGHCDPDSRDADQGQYVDAEQEPDASTASLPAVGTASIGGEEVYVFEDGPDTIYVSVDTGYPVRIEGPTTQADFHSWGATDPISLPDECP